MNRLQNILRMLFFLLAMGLIFYLNEKTGVNLGTVAKFKYETLHKVNSDSLDNKARLDLLVQETTKLNDQIKEDSSHAQDMIYYLMGVVCLFVVSELIFYGRRKKV